MKPTIKQITLFAAVSSAFVSAGAAQPMSEQGSEQTLTVQLATHKTVYGTYEKDPETGATLSPKVPTGNNSWSKGDVDYSEYVTKIVTQKYGNKQILEEFVDAFPQMGGSVVGWSIKLIETTEDLSTDDGQESGFFLVKKDETPIDISMYLSVGDFANARAANHKETTDALDNTTYKGSENWIDSVTVNLDPDDSDYASLALVGLATGSATVKKIDGIYAWYNNSETIKVVGASYFPEDYPEYGYEEYRSTEGTLQFSAAKPLVDVSGYFYR